MRIWSLVLGLLALLMVAPACMTPAAAQDAAGRVWVQIEAQPDLATALDRARAYAAVFPKVEGYKLGNGWFGIAIGPMTSEDAVAQLHSLMAQNMIPGDSYITDGQSFGAQYWPAEGQANTSLNDAGQNASGQTDSGQVGTPTLAPAEPVAPSVAADETLAEARASEAALSAADRQELQSALKWFGYYAGKVDGNIGSGSRASMAAWQGAEGFDPTGVLTSAQRQTLLEGYRSEEQGLGFQTVNEPEAGIEITLPMAMLSFDRYTPPFVRYAPKDDSGLTAMLISEPGTKASLAALYDALQSLELMPAEGERALEDGSFTIHGQNGKIETLAYAEVSGSNVKGYLLSWDRSLAEKMQRVLPMVQSSFRSTGEKALDPGLVPLADAVKRGLLDGLAAKKPKASQSGFFIDGKGSVLTSDAGLAACGKITLERGVPAKVTWADKTAGVAVLTPETVLAPKAVAEFAGSAPSVGAALSLSGYSYGDRLPAPVLTRGTLEAGQGLNGEAGLAQLALEAMPGDVGGPVLDASGAVVGMLLPAPAGGKELPPGVAFAATASELAPLLSNPQGPGLALQAAAGTSKLTPDAFNAAARGMTVLVSCWP